MEVDKIGVHATHCCILHGCKYGEKDCPVTNGKITQVYPCQDCRTQGEYFGRMKYPHGEMVKDLVEEMITYGAVFQFTNKKTDETKFYGAYIVPDWDCGSIVSFTSFSYDKEKNVYLPCLDENKNVVEISISDISRQTSRDHEIIPVASGTARRTDWME